LPEDARDRLQCTIKNPFALIARDRHSFAKRGSPISKRLLMT
jgi:hypothetical protein